MNTQVAIAETPQRPAYTQSPVTAMPRDALGMMIFAKELSKATSLPAQFKNPADLCMALMVLTDLGIKNSLLALQEMSLIKGRWFFSGKLCGAIINTSPQIAEGLSYKYLGEGEKRSVVVSARLANEATAREAWVRMEDVRTENKMWDTQPDQQLAYAGNRIWGRRYAPQLLLGMSFEGEIIDVTPGRDEPRQVAIGVESLRAAPSIDPGKPAIDPALSQDERSAMVDAQSADNMPEERVPAANIPSRAERENTGPFRIEREANTIEGFRTWAALLMAYIRAAPDADAINNWTTINADHFDALKKLDSDKHDNLIDAIEKELAARSEQ